MVKIARPIYSLFYTDAHSNNTVRVVVSVNFSISLLRESFKILWVTMEYGDLRSVALQTDFTALASLLLTSLASKSCPGNLLL